MSRMKNLNVVFGSILVPQAILVYDQIHCQMQEGTLILKSVWFCEYY